MEGKVAHATIYLVYCDDCQPAWTKPLVRMAVRILALACRGYSAHACYHDWRAKHYLLGFGDNSGADPNAGWRNGWNDAE